MIEFIHLQGFQIHEDFYLELDQSVTSLVGPTSIGKSATLRGLKWATLNDPPKKGRYINFDSKVAKVSVGIDGRKIIREKSEESNLYFFDNKKYVSFGQGVPEEIESFLNLGTENFAGQLENSFWLSLSPGQAGKALNRVVNLEIIDNTLTFASSEIKKAKIAEELSSQRLKEAEEKEKQLEKVEELDSRLKDLEEKEKKLDKKRNKISKLEKLIGDYLKTEQKTNKISKELLDSIKNLDEKKTKIESLRKEITSLESLVLKAERIEEEICQSNMGLQSAKMELEKISQGNCPLCQNPMMKL